MDRVVTIFIAVWGLGWLILSIWNPKHIVSNMYGTDDKKIGPLKAGLGSVVTSGNQYRWGMAGLGFVVLIIGISLSIH
jgi:hypothetical protein